MEFEESKDLFIKYLACEKGLSENYQISMQQSLTKFQRWLKEGALDWQSLSTDDLLKYVKAMVDKQLEASTSAVYITHLKLFYKYASTSEWVEKDIAESLQKPKGKEILPNTLSEDSIQNILESINLEKRLGARDKAILETFYASGLRLSELANARLEHIDLGERIIRVTGKGNKTRRVPLGRKAQLAIQAYLVKERSTLVKPSITSSHIFLSVRGGKLSPDRIRKIVKERAKEAGVSTNVYPHLLRHSCATHLLQNGADLRIIQELLGHVDIATTQVYTHVDQKSLKAIHRAFHTRG